MKKLLTSVTAVSVLGMSVLFGGYAAHANGFDDDVQNDNGNTQRRGIHTEGKISFTADDQAIIVVPPVEDGPDVDIDPLPGEGENFGPLTIAYAPTLNFGQQIVSLESKEYHMIAEMQRLDGSNETVPYVSFVQVQDRRGTNDGWNLYVTAYEFESNSEHHSTLTGTEIRFFNSALQHSGDANNAPDVTGLQTVVDINNQTIDGVIVLTPGQSRRIMAAGDGKGAGISSLVWGDQAQLNADHENADISEVLNPAIQLFVPDTSIQNAATYEAKLHWQLVAGHANTLPSSEQ